MRNSLGGRSIRESRLGRVPLARDADRLGGMTAAEFLVRCPSGTFPIADVCVETTARQPAPYGTATVHCASSGTPAGPGKRLPTHGELLSALSGLQLAPGGELTSEVLPSTTEGQLNVLFVTDQGGGIGVTPDTFAGAKAFRCVSDPLN